MAHFFTAAILTGGLVLTAHTGEAATFFGPTPYLSSADTPAGFHDGPVFLEDFEDGTLDGGITASVGGVLTGRSDTDSVDGDDGAIDGSGVGGSSFFTVNAVAGFTFSFANPVTSFGLVMTDGLGPVTFKVFGVGATTLFDDTVAVPWDNVFNGTTAEDRFFGLSDTIGITSVFVSTPTGGLEVDHLQYSVASVDTTTPVPVPAGFPLMFGALGGLALLRRRKT